MDKKIYERRFIAKVKHFKNNVRYDYLRSYAITALYSMRNKDTLKLWAIEFIEKMIVMPENYIESWLRNENKLSYRECDKRMLMAFRGGYMELQSAHMDMDIHRISASMLPIYQKYGYHIVQQQESYILVGKEDEK